MAQMNLNFREFSVDSQVLESISAERSLWFESTEDRQRRYAFQDFFRAVTPFVDELIDSTLTSRQRQVVMLYYRYGKTQEDIAQILDLAQSTVSRHLFGTLRGGRKVGGAIPKLRKLVQENGFDGIDTALAVLEEKLAEAG